MKKWEKAELIRLEISNTEHKGHGNGHTEHGNGNGYGHDKDHGWGCPDVKPDYPLS